jgi:cysteine-rich repeat protein
MSGGSFTLSYATGAPGCGDGYVDQSGQYGPAETCDDGNATASDGCSASCHVESGYSCSGSPSACYAPLAGDTCDVAQPLVSDVYNMDGYQAECGPMNCSPDRWFSTQVPAGDLIVVHVTSNSPQSNVRLFNLTGAGCNMPQTVAMQSMGAFQDITLAWQAVGGQATVALELADTWMNPSNAQYVVDVHVGAPACGDGFVDTNGTYGPQEQCDDGNTSGGDSCSPTCMSN